MYVAKTKALISFAVTAKLIWVFVFAYAKKRVSHDAAQIEVNVVTKLYELHYEKTCFLHMRKHKCRSAAWLRTADQRLCLHYIHSTTLLLPKSEISSLLPSFVAVQPGLCWTWSET